MHPEIRMTQCLKAIRGFKQGSLVQYLAGHFKGFPQMGARDRREVGGMVFNYFRVKRLFTNQPEESLILAAQLLCQPGSYPGFVAYWSEKLWQSKVESTPENAFDFLKPFGFEPQWERYFPLNDAISPLIDKHAFLKAHLLQPALWVRIKKGKEKVVREEFEKLGISYQLHNELPLACQLTAGTKLDGLKAWQNGHIEVQDIASQATAALFNPQAGERWLDACAGAGGKSLLLYDLEPAISLFVTDTRDYMLKHLHERFKKAGLRNYSQAVVDQSVAGALSMQKSFPKQFDAVLADVPCSGSGTWSSTPELMDHINLDKLDQFTQKQLAITRQLGNALKKGGRLIYLTCSVYAAENENLLAQLNDFKVEKQQYFQFTDQGGDVLFGAVLKKVN
jgi:16S rRNA (cytosine967-C5)-methyltransferase